MKKKINMGYILIRRWIGMNSSKKTFLKLLKDKHKKLLKAKKTSSIQTNKVNLEKLYLICKNY